MAVAVAHVHRRGGLAVGGQREQPHVAGFVRGALLMNQRDDGLRSLVPADEWRHLPDRLGGEQLDQPVDVVGLERGDITPQPVLRVLGVGRHQPVVGTGPSGVELRPRTLQQAVDGGRTGADRVGYLGGLPLQHVAQ
jgi:hypothetical protein